MNQTEIKGSINAHRLWYHTPAANFNEALPLGNGRIGAMFYGAPSKEHIDLNEDTLWSGYPRSSELICDDIYRKAEELAEKGEFTDAEQLLQNRFGDFLVQMYLPLGSIDIVMQHVGAKTNYYRELRLDTGINTVEYDCGGVHYMRRAFVSEPNQILAIEITADRPHSVSLCAVLNSALKAKVYFEDYTQFIEGNAPICLADYGKTTALPEAKFYSAKDSEKGVGYLAALKPVIKGGTAVVDGNILFVENADSVIFYFAVRTSFNGPFNHPVTHGAEYSKRCREDIRCAEETGFEQLLCNSVNEHKALYLRTELDLGESEISGLTTDERLNQKALGKDDPALYALLFHYGRYLTIASSRPGSEAMNLQGIWNKELCPMWSSNYTLNINTEMNYWPTLAAGLEECYEPLIRFAEQLYKAGKKTAKNYYGAPGWVSHHASDLWKTTHPSTNRLKDSCKWGFWNISSGWLCRMLYDYYLHTEDTDYLRRIYPIISEAADFYLYLLVEKDGYLLLSPSTSPENQYISEDNVLCALDITTTMTVAVLRELFNIASEAGKLLNKEASKYKEAEERLPPYRINADGSLCEWYSEHRDYEVHHRHMSHLYGLFPSEQITSDSPKLFSACKKTLENRGDGATGWSLAWKINLWARLRDGNHALRLIDRMLMPIDSCIDRPLCEGGSYPNLFCAHPPFQVDGNFGVCRGFTELLVQYDQAGNPVFLPALPDAWRDGVLYGCHLRGGKITDIRWKNGTLV